MKSAPGIGARVRTALAWLCLAGCVFWYVRETIWMQLPGLTGTPSDFRPYHNAAREVVAGRSPFNVDGYIYPPLLAFAVTPLAPFDYVTARRLWFAISQLLLVAAAVLLWWGSGRDLPAACWIAFVWATGGAAEESLGLGQLGPLLAFVLVLAYVWRGWLVGAAVGCGFALKLLPGILGIGIALRRFRPQLAGMFASASLLLVVPWLIVLCCLEGPKSPPGANAWTGTPATLSWSLPSVALRLLDRPTRVAPLPDSWVVGVDLPNQRLPFSKRLVAGAVCLITLCGGLIVFLRAIRWRLSAAQWPWAAASLMALALAASPVGWTHYQVMQYPGVAMLLSQTWRSRAWVRLACALALAALLYPLPVAILTAYYNSHGGWTAASPLTLYTWTSVTPVASLLLFGLFVHQSSAAGRLPEAAGAPES